jgi:XTP/dITP diphosphohydrolase
MKEIFIASRNSGKIREILEFLYQIDPGIKLRSLLDVPEIPDIEETGKTFEENALQKAKSVFEIVKVPVIADDSGLEVDFLDGRPGVLSARYSGEGASDQENCNKLLNELRGVKSSERKARFKCVIIFYGESNTGTYEGTCEGVIGNSLSGTAGFGYDPLFIPNGYTETFAELPIEVKNKISHRGKALQKFEASLMNWLRN